MLLKQHKRLYQITRIFWQYRLDLLFPASWLPWYVKYGRFAMFWIRPKAKHECDAARLRLALEELGPVFVKFGQMLSTRRDLLPPQYAEELAKLQDRVPPFCEAEALTQIEKALGQKVTDVFESFEATPMASASIAQVHGARLQLDGNLQDVVIKVIRPGIERIIDADIALMYLFAGLAENFLPDGKRLRPREVVLEYKKTLIDELDLMREAANGIQLRRNFEGSDSLYVPEMYSDFCRQNILVMERIDGIPVSDIDALNAQNTNMKRLAERGVEVFFTQVFRDSFFHADMHPGNIFVSREHPENPLYIGVDFGIVGTLNRDDKRYLAENFLAFFNRDYRKVAELHVASGWVPSDTNVEEFEFAIRTVCEPIFQKPLAEISFGHVLLNLFNTARRFNMQVQPQLVLLQKTLLYVEGLGRQLYPQLDLWQTAKPFLEDWMQNQIGPKALWREIKENAPYWGEKLPEMPNLIYDGLIAVKQFNEQYQQQIKHTEKVRMYQMQAYYWLATAAILAVMATVLHLDVEWPVTMALGVGSFVCWAKGWLLSRKRS
ncbi:ubiquinone biosynthesis regulatory protein kinase UbiB [Echinimonas agarilytica]|uniref:Probable protein kinase UbiB n=1 Tax=Echinimonas agarilytica TaxID=1215918 RepID=A0AA42B6B0_9GAMM|nr:ubiquinone biosynthesis regulatory protein kinase UbiB [Echinimonas agarilytica]MCM2678236.1 ubiquinone biosynthesis regulatory protein kinase UbiB [Echinimonas agarilytica]